MNNVLEKLLLIVVITMATGTYQISCMESKQEQSESLEMQLISTIKRLQSSSYDTYNNPLAKKEARTLVTKLSYKDGRTDEEIKSLIKDAKNFILSNEEITFNYIHGNM